MSIISLYHGTSLKSVESIIKNGLVNSFVTGDPYRAEWFGLSYGTPVVLEVRIDTDFLYWANMDGKLISPASQSDLNLEDDLADEDEYLLYTEYIPPTDISIHSKGRKYT